MSTATTIIEGMVMEGKLDAGETPVLIAGHFTGELNANEVILDPTGVFNGQINANRVELGGNFSGKLITEELSIGSTAVIDGDLKSNALVIELGAEVIAFSNEIDLLSKSNIISSLSLSSTPPNE